MKKALFLVAVLVACLAVPVLAGEDDASSAPYTITFYPSNGEAPWQAHTDANGYLAGDGYSRPPTKEGYTFSHWESSDGRTFSAYGPWYTSYHQDTSVTAVYIENEGGNRVPVMSYIAVVILLVLFIILMCMIFLT